MASPLYLTRQSPRDIEFLLPLHNLQRIHLMGFLIVHKVIFFSFFSWLNHSGIARAVDKFFLLFYPLPQLLSPSSYLALVTYLLPDKQNLIAGLQPLTYCLSYPWQPNLLS